jgi:hypothetical protein
MGRAYTREADYWGFVERAREALARYSPGAQIRVEGSLATGELVPGYSDLDLRILAPPDEGQNLRDRLPQMAASLGELLAIFVDPYSAIGTICSLYPGPFKVDWFVSEVLEGGERDIWSGSAPPPYDEDAHPWDWVWWLWGKVRRGEGKLGAEELSKLWLFLVLRGEHPGAFPASVPPRDQEVLREQIVDTLDYLPAPDQKVAREVAAAIREDYRGRGKTHGH